MSRHGPEIKPLYVPTFVARQFPFVSYSEIVEVEVRYKLWGACWDITRPNTKPDKNKLFNLRMSTFQVDRPYKIHEGILIAVYDGSEDVKRWFTGCEGFTSAYCTLGKRFNCCLCGGSRVSKVSHQDLQGIGLHGFAEHTARKLRGNWR